MAEERKLGCLSVVGIVLLTILVSVGLTIWAMNYFLFQKEFKPVTLNAKEETVLEQKLNGIGIFGAVKKETPQQDAEILIPEAYSEEGADRSIHFTEKELNALLAKNTDLANKLAIDLADNLASGKLLVPLEPDFPIMGGKTLKVSAGMELAYENARPIVILKGVSVMGVPIPNAWLGGLKNVDLIKEFGGEEGFWKAFADGVDNIRVQEGKLFIQLKE
jgi:hypothetical protein